MPEKRAPEGGSLPCSGDGFGLAEEIIASIRRYGPITFARFMEMAMYMPGKGYYTTGKETWGPEGDYITSLDVSPLFAKAVARGVDEMWGVLGSPASFGLVEAGAGRGWLSKGILSALQEVSPGLLASIGISLVERNPALRQAPSGGTNWYASIDDVPPFEYGCVLSNELIDSFPVHRVLFSGGSLRELYVDHDGSAFIERPGPLSTAELEEYFREAAVEPFEGMLTEVNLEAPGWIARAAGLLQRGFVVTIDYGLPSRELYSPERRGSLLCHYRHTLNDDPFMNIGRQDITAHVDFTSLAGAGKKAGLGLTGFTTQKNFLLGLGILDEMKVPGDGPAGLDGLAFNRNLARLIAPGGMGDAFKVLIQHKGIEKPALLGFSFKDMSRNLMP